ncbi:hypothetical protein [Methylomonas sp. AM2-LC]|uniref:hypothetical protein n=1 Tax=Methylomonas sp. AM2-LC TaxID=3153301 RepID=UPI0032632423
MRQLIATTLSVMVLATLSATLHAETLGQINIPDKVKADILKRHPKAIELQASHEIHFQKKLLEVSFKEEGSNDLILELFREDSHLFANELLLDDLSEAPSEVKTTLEKEFPGYKVIKSEMIANPNGVGEEYEVYIQVGAVNWKVSLTEKGVVQGKDQY